MYKSLLALIGAIFLAGPAFAADWPIVTDRDGTQTKTFTAVAGDSVVLTASSTQDIVHWDFISSAVRICVQGGAILGEAVYYRINNTSPDTISSGTSSQFINGGGGSFGADGAGILTAGGDGTDTDCEIYPFHVKGFEIHSPASPVTIDVTAYN